MEHFSTKILPTIFLQRKEIAYIFLQKKVCIQKNFVERNFHTQKISTEKKSLPKKILWKIYFAVTKTFWEILLKTKFAKKKVTEKKIANKIFFRKRNRGNKQIFAKIYFFLQKIFCQKIIFAVNFFSLIELSGAEIKLAHNLGIWNLESFFWLIWFSLVEIKITRNLGSWNLACQFISQ